MVVGRSDGCLTNWQIHVLSCCTMVETLITRILESNVFICRHITFYMLSLCVCVHTCVLCILLYQELCDLLLLESCYAWGGMSHSDGCVLSLVHSTWCCEWAESADSAAEGKGSSESLACFGRDHEKVFAPTGGSEGVAAYSGLHSHVYLKSSGDSEPSMTLAWQFIFKGVINM